MSTGLIPPSLYEILTYGFTGDIEQYRELQSIHGGPVLDLGSGLGRISLPMWKDGVQTVLFDHNPAMCDTVVQRIQQDTSGLEHAIWVLHQDLTTATHLDENAVRNHNPHPIPSQFGLIILGLRTLHLFDKSTRWHILSFALQHLSPTGALVIHHSDFSKSTLQRQWTLTAEHPIESGMIEVEECLFQNTKLDRYHLRHRIWQSNEHGQHIGSWRVAHDLYPIQFSELQSTLKKVGYRHVETQPLYEVDSLLIATL